jgi:hypothetical protein
LAVVAPPNRSTGSASSASASLNPSRGELPILEATTDLNKWFVPLLNGLPRRSRHRLALQQAISRRVDDHTLRQPGDGD